MKIDKKKLAFSAVLVIVLLFMFGYYQLVLGDTGDNANELQQTTVPKLKEEQRTFTSKKEAVDALEEKKERNAPSLWTLKSNGWWTVSTVWGALVIPIVRTMEN